MGDVFAGSLLELELELVLAVTFVTGGGDDVDAVGTLSLRTATFDHDGAVLSKSASTADAVSLAAMQSMLR